MAKNKKNKKKICSLDLLTRLEKAMKGVRAARKKLKKTKRKLSALHGEIASAKPCKEEKSEKPKSDKKKKKSKKKSDKKSASVETSVLIEKTGVDDASMLTTPLLRIDEDVEALENEFVETPDDTQSRDYLIGYSTTNEEGEEVVQEEVMQEEVMQEEVVQEAGQNPPVGLLNMSGEVTSEEADDLKLVNGIGPTLEEVLNGLGVYNFAQIAAWGRAEIEWVEEYLEFPGRIERDNWIEQAKALAKGGRDEYVKVFGKEPR